VLAVLGAGTVELVAGDTLHARLIGSGDVVLRGEPRVLTLDRFGRGALHRR
jgi:hypothetical protein